MIETGCLDMCIDSARGEGWDDMAQGAEEELKDLVEWKRAIEDACIVDWVNITTPKETIQSLIAWNVKMALDPAISEEAQKLIEQGRREGTNEYPNH